MKRLLAVQAAVVALGLAGLAGTASATAPMTPTGYPGAWNMLNDPTMLPGSGGAMDHANPHGDAGMCRAVLVSSGIGC